MASKKSSSKKPHSSGTKKSIHKSRSRTPTHTHSPTHTHKSRTHTHSKKHVPRTGASTTKHSHSRYTKRSPPRTRVGASSSLGPGLADPLLYIFLVLLGISVIALFVVGVWLLAARDGWPHGLNHTGSVHYTRLISYGTACIVAAILLLFVVLFSSLAAAARSGAGARVNRLVAVALASIVFLIFILMIITGIMFASHGPAFIANIVRDSWVRSVENDDTVGGICDFQRDNNCQGWYDNQCRTCRPTVDGVYDYTTGVGSSCDQVQRQFCPRCFNSVGGNPTGNPIGNPGGEQVFTPVGDTLVNPGGGAQGQGQVRRRSIVSALDLTSNMSLSSVVRSEVAGCRRYVRSRNRTFFIPMSVYLIFLAIILLFLSWKTCLDSSGRR